MSLRVVLAVALAVAVVAVALPGIDEAAQKRTAHQIRGEVGSVANAGESLLDRDERTARGSPGARRTVSVSLPSRSLAAAGIDYVAIGGFPGNGGGHSTVRYGRVTYRLRDGPRRRFQVPVPLGAPGDRPVILRESGSHRLVLSLGRHDGDRVVLVERAR